MADIGTALRAVLTADSGVSALCGTRIYPDQLPQGCAFAAIRYSVISDRSDQHQGGGSALAEASVQIDCYAQTRLAANALGNAARLALARHRGTAASVFIRDVDPGYGRTGFESPDDAGDLGLYVHSRDVRAWYTEDV